MTGNIIGEEFKEYVLEQIQARQKIYGSGLNSSRTPEQINYLNNRNVWIKMASSVKVEDDIRITNLNIPQTNVNSFKGNNLAQKAILFNTVSELSYDNKQNPSYILRQGIATNNSLWNNSTYGLGGADFGLQPPPGILSAEVNTINRGSIRKTTVKLKVYNKFQFELIELLYLRIGFTMMLEWGWDKYVNNKTNKVESVGNSLIEEFWFNQQNDNSTQLQVLKQIELFRERYQGNYDGFFGKVSNYNWTLSSDGSYDISIDLISLGDVIESLQVRISATSNFITTEDQDKPLLSSMGQTTIEQWLYKALNNKKFKDGSDYILLGGVNPTNKYKASYKWGNNSSTIGEYDSDIYNQDIYHHMDPKYKYYVSFGEFINQLEQLCIPKIENGTSSEPQLYFDKDLENILIKYFPNQISLDPRVCLIKPYLFPSDFSDVFPNTDNLKNYISPNYKILLGQLMNLYLNFDFIIQTLKSNIDKEGKLSLFKFLENICEGVNISLGNVNKIQPIIKEENIITFIDQSLQSSPSINKSKTDTAVIEVYGYNRKDGTSNFVKDIKFQTKLTKETAAMISIGATASGDETSIKNGDATAFSKWNEGLIDRFCQKITDPSEESKQQQNTTQEIKRWTVVWPASRLQELYPDVIQKYFPGTILTSTQSSDIMLLINNYIDNQSLLLQTPKNNQESAAQEIAGREIDRRSKIVINPTEENFKSDPITGYLAYIVDSFGGDTNLKINDGEGSKPYHVDSSKSNYYNYNPQFIEMGKSLYKAYITKKSLQIYNSTKKQSSQIGFLPLEFDLTVEGISGMKIYNKLNISQNFLPSNYPKTFDFLVTKLNHKIELSGWNTEIGTLSTSNIDDIEDQINNYVPPVVQQSQSMEKVVPYSDNQKRVAHLLKLKGLSIEQVSGIMGNIQQESRFNPLEASNKVAAGLIQWEAIWYGGKTKTTTGVFERIGKTIDSQITFLTNGSTDRYSQWVRSSNSSKTPEETAISFCNIVERAGIPFMTNRTGYARYFYNQLNKEDSKLNWKLL